MAIGTLRSVDKWQFRNHFRHIKMSGLGHKSPKKGNACNGKKKGLEADAITSS